MGNELTRTAMSLLRPGETERFAFSEDATSLLSRAVADAIVRPSGEEELLALLRLVVALKTDLSSPTAALAIEAVVQGSGRACALLLSNRRAWKQRTVRLLGRATNLRARHTAGSSPIGSIRLSTMIDPVSRRPMNGKRGRR